MQLQMYTVYDAAVKAFLQPFFARSHGEALRSFQDAFEDEKHQFSRHPHDFSLFFVGTFDDGNADFDKPLAPEKLLSGGDVIGKKP